MIHPHALTDLAFIAPEIPQLVNLLVFLGITYYLVRKPTAQWFHERRQRIRRELNHARVEREKAQAKLREIEARLARLDEEIEELKRRAQAEAEAEEVRIQAQARLQAEKLRAQARRDIESAARAAQLELKAFVAQQTVELARSLIRQQMTEEDHHRLVEVFSDRLQEVRQ